MLAKTIENMSVRFIWSSFSDTKLIISSGNVDRQNNSPRRWNNNLTEWHIRVDTDCGHLSGRQRLDA
jgi:hypothetical protein